MTGQDRDERIEKLHAKVEAVETERDEHAEREIKMAAKLGIALGEVGTLQLDVERLKVDLRCAQIQVEDRGASYAEAVAEVAARDRALDACADRIAALLTEGGASDARIDELADHLIDERAEVARLLAARDTAQRHVDELTSELELARGVIAQGQKASAGIVERAFRAGVEFARDKAEVSEHDGWHRCAPFIEWPKDGAIDEAARAWKPTP